MQSADNLKQGDFTHLAQMYSQYRPGYANSVLNAILGIMNKPIKQLDVADVGAGTGIWTRMLANMHCSSVTAIEPNDEMRTMGMQHPVNHSIQWHKGSGEHTGLQDESVDLLSMASSFHWVNFEAGTKEFHRVLRPEGRFVALWNPRYIDDNPLLIDIEKKMYELAPHIKRISSGKSDFVNAISQRLLNSIYFTDLVYLEGRHQVQLTPEQYIGVWNSVNDVRAQMGEKLFTEFMHYIKEKIIAQTTIACTYLTRAWIVKKKC